MDYPFKLPAKSWPKVETPPGKTSLLKMPICSFTTLNPEDWIPFMNLSCSQLWFEQYRVDMTFCIIDGPLFFPPCCFFPPETSIQERSQAKQHFYTAFWDGCLACWCSQNFLYLICLCSLSQTSASNTPPVQKPWGAATAVPQCMNKLLPLLRVFLVVTHFTIKMVRKMEERFR